MRMMFITRTITIAANNSPHSPSMRCSRDKRGSNYRLVWLPIIIIVIPLWRWWWEVVVVGRAIIGRRSSSSIIRLLILLLW